MGLRSSWLLSSSMLTSSNLSQSQGPTVSLLKPTRQCRQQGLSEPWRSQLSRATYIMYEPLLPLSQKTQLPSDRLLTDWSNPEEPELLVINEVLQVTPVFRHPHHPNWPDKGRGVQGHYTSEEDAAYSAPSLPPPKALIAETGQLVDLYKMLGSRGPDSKPEHLTSPLTVLSVDYLPTHEGYLPSNIEYLPSHEDPVTDSLEELEPQHICLSVFPSSSLHPLTFSCDKKLTLDRLKMGCSSLML